MLKLKLKLKLKEDVCYYYNTKVYINPETKSPSRFDFIRFDFSWIGFEADIFFRKKLTSHLP